MFIVILHLILKNIKKKTNVTLYLKCLTFQAPRCCVLNLLYLYTVWINLTK